MSDVADTGSCDDILMGERMFNASCDGLDTVVRAMLLDGVHANEWRDWNECTALHGAARKGHTGVARLLIEERADIEAKSESGKTPLFCASISGGHLLLARGANVMARDDSGMTPLHSAADAMFTNGERIETLVLWGAVIDARDAQDMPPRRLTSLWRNRFGSFPGPGFEKSKADAIFDGAVARARGLFWTPALHPQLPRPARETVVTWLLCQRRVATAMLSVALHKRPQLPALPIELLEMILGMLRAVDLLPRRA